MNQSAPNGLIRQYRTWVILGGLAIAVIALIVWRVVTGPASDVTLTALSADSAGLVAPDTAFRLKTKAGQDIDALRQNIAVEPEIAYDLTEQEPGDYLLTPLKLLDAGADIVFTVGQARFPFTVQNRLQALSIFPVDGGENIPVRSGIEFVFNTQSLSREQFEAAFSIEPAIEGYFSIGDRRYAFYPEGEFAYGTEYTVTLSSDMASEDGAKLDEELRVTFTTISEMEESLRNLFQVSGRGSVNSLTGEAPLIQVYIDQSVANPEQSVAVTLHAFDGWESYLAAIQSNIAYSSGDYWYGSSFLTDIDVTGLAEYAAFDVMPIQSQSASEYNTGAWVIQFPDTLPEGWYTATLTLEIDGSPVSRTIFLQVSDLSVFYMVYDNDLLAWVNDASTGEPVGGAQVEITGAYRASGATGEDGTVHIADGTPPEFDNKEVSTYLTVRSGERVFVDTDIYYTSYGDGADLSNAYMSYLFTDRPLYHTTDTIQVWGMVRPRVAGTPLPEELRLELGDDILSQAVTPLPNGTFTATLEVENIAGSLWPVLRLMAGEDEFFYLSLRFEDFVKPIYTAVTAPEQPVYLLSANDEIRVGMDVSTFDGTPVSDFGIRIGSWSSGLEIESEQLRTDSRGHISTAFRVNEELDTWYPQSYYYEFYSDEAQDEGFYLQGNAYALHRDVMLRAVPDLESRGSRVEVSTHRIDISRVQTPEQVWEKDILRGAALSQPVTATVSRVYYEKIKTGTHYDFVNRVSVDSFRYEQVEEVVDTREFSTVNGTYILEELPVSDDESCYYVTLETVDSAGRTVKTSAYLGDIYSRYGSHDTGTHNYTLVKQTDPAFAAITEYSGSVRIESRNAQFEDGEDAVFLLLDNDLPVEDLQGRLLYSVVQERFSETGVVDQGQFTMPFSESLLPNYIITGAYFDGKHVFALENTYMSFNPDRRELEIQLAPDRDTYRPADQLQVEATVTNSFTGEPAADTEVVISVVDEAVFAIQEQYPYILQKMYQDVYYPYIRKYTSYLQLDFGGPGEKGGGGGENMRTEFEDTAYFATGTTDSEGRVRFVCQLPDNITSWRLTSLALTPDNHAGNTKTNVSATKEFFILPVVNELLLEGDSFSVGVYGTGTEVSDSDSVRYAITVQGEGVDETQEVTATLREYATALFGNLKTGDYTVTIAAECREYGDGVQLPFSVVPSGVEVSLVKSFALEEGIRVDSLRYPVGISFYGADTKAYQTVFQSVYNVSTGGRADMRLASRYVAQQFQKQDADWYNSSILDEDISDLSGRYMLSLFPYSEQDLELTAKARLALPEMVSAGALRGLDATNIGEYTGAKSAVYLANVLADEPPTANLHSMLEGSGDLDYVDRMYLALALALSGDAETARGWYDELVLPNLAELTGLAGDTALYIDFADNSRSQGDCTAAASLLATALSTDEAAGLARYLAEKASAYEPYLFEQIYYLQLNEPSAASPASFSYTRGGQTQTVELNRGAVSISFTQKQLAEASFVVNTGEIMADVYYAGAPDQVDDDSKRLIGFTKTLEPVGGGFGVGELVKITLTPDFSALDSDIGDTMLVVDDYIPTGMRFERYDHGYDAYEHLRGWHLNSRQGQRLQYTVYGVGTLNVKPIVYYARCSTLGNYVVESAYITSATGEIWGATERDTVSIQ